MISKTGFKPAEQQIIEGIEGCIADNGFAQNKIDLDKEHYADFIKKQSGLKHRFSIRFLFYKGNVLGVEPAMTVSFDRISEIVNKALGLNEEFYSVSTRLGALLNPKNKDGFFNSNDNVEIEFKVTEANVKKAIAKVYDPFFTQAGSMFIDKTDSLEVLDNLINGWVLKTSPGTELKSLAYFESHRPWQISTGIISAKLANRPDYDELLKRYVAFAETKDPKSNMWIKNFYTIAAYLKNMK